MNTVLTLVRAALAAMPFTVPPLDLLTYQIHMPSPSTAAARDAPGAASPQRVRALSARIVASRLLMRRYRGNSDRDGGLRPAGSLAAAAAGRRRAAQSSAATVAGRATSSDMATTTVVTQPANDRYRPQSGDTNESST